MGQADRIQSHPLFDASFSEIVDFSSITQVDVSDEVIRTLASRDSIFANQAIHIVIAPRGLISQLAKAYQALVEQHVPTS